MSARILIIEDEEPLTLLLRYNLEAEGYDVETSARGDEGETKLKESPPGQPQSTSYSSMGFVSPCPANRFRRAEWCYRTTSNLGT